MRIADLLGSGGAQAYICKSQNVIDKAISRTPDVNIDSIGGTETSIGGVHDQGNCSCAVFLAQLLSASCIRSHHVLGI